MSDDKPKPLDENDKLKAGQLSSNAFDGTKRIEPLRAIEAPRKIGEPSDVPSEAALLGAFLWAASNSPDILRATVVQDILPSGEAFYRRDFGNIYDAMLECLRKDEMTGKMPIEHDPVAVASAAAIAGNGRDDTSVDALLKLQAAASTVSELQARAYADSVRKAWAKRCAIRDLRVIASDALSPKVSDTEIYERAQKAALEMMDRTSSTATTVSLRQSAEQLFVDLSSPGAAAFPTGLRDMDTMTNGGIRAPETSIVAARTNVGKSTLAVGVAQYIVATDPTAGALYVSMEMPHKSFTTKLLASRTPGVTVAAIRRKALNKDQWAALTSTVKDILELELHFTVSMQQTLASVFAIARERDRVLKRAGKKLKLVVIDHIGLVKPSVELLKRASRQQQVAETSRGLRYIATEVGCHVMALAQIHRDAERQKSADMMPKLHHLREAGDLEQDADQIFIMHRPRDPMSGIFVKGKPTAFALAKGRLDETAVTLLNFRDGRYEDWTDPDRDFETEYGSGERDDEARRPRVQPPKKKAPAGPSQSAGPTKEQMAEADNGVVELLVNAVGSALLFEDLVVAMGDPKGDGNGPGMMRVDVERWLKAAIDAGRLGVEGDGDKRRLWRKK